VAELPTPGLTQTRFGCRYYAPEVHTLFEVVDLHRKSGELWGEMTIRCNLEGVRGQLDGNRLRQGNYNFSSVTARQSWAKALAEMVPKELNDKLEWGNLLEHVSQAVLDHERAGSIRGHVITGKRMGPTGRPWAAWPILPHHENATLFSKGGAGKTSLVADIVLSLGLGRSLIPGMRVDRSYRVAVLDWETNVETAEELWGLIAETHKVAVPPTIWYEPMEQSLERSLPLVSNILDQHRADLVVIDSVGMALLSSGEFSDPAESIIRAYQSLRRLETWGLLIDHVAAADLHSQRPSLKAYGSIYKTNLARHALALHIGDRAGDTKHAYLLCPKSNVGRGEWAMSGTVVRSDTELRWEFGDPDYDLYERLMGGEEESEESTSRATPRWADKILGVLLAHYPRAQTVKAVTSALGLDEKREAFIRKSLHRLKEDGLVVAVDQQGTLEKVWALTQEGINLAASVRNQPTTGASEEGAE
jgi:hypothetical protein